MPMTQTQLADAVAEKAGLSRADAKKAISALEEVILDEIGNAEKVKIGGVVQLDVRVRPATAERPGRNPATGEEITISAKPASVAVKARPLAKAKNAAAALVFFALPAVASAAPAITDVQASASVSSALVTWHTGEPVRGRVAYGV